MTPGSQKGQALGWRRTAVLRPTGQAGRLPGGGLTLDRQPPRKSAHFKTKPQIALDQLRAAHAAGIPLGTVLADAGYGYDSQFRDGITKLGLLRCVHMPGLSDALAHERAPRWFPRQGFQKTLRPSKEAIGSIGVSRVMD
jgi:hypothetical protein